MSSRKIIPITFIVILTTLILLVMTASTEEPNPHFRVWVENDSISAWDWPEGTAVTLTIDDDNDPGNGVLLTDTQFAVTDSGGTIVNFDLMGFDIQPGHFVTMTDGGTILDHVVTNLNLSGVSPVQDTITGTADPGTEIAVDVWGTGYLTAITAPDGTWVVDFSQIGLDLTPGMNGDVEQWDSEGDAATRIDWYIPNPFFAVRPNDDNIDGWEWLPDNSISVTINGTQSFAAQTDEWGNFQLQLNSTYDIIPGDYIEVTDGTTTKIHTVTGLRILSVDVDLDLVLGQASPGAQIQVWACEGPYCVNRWEIVDGSGNWQADFSVPGDEVGEEQTFDILPGTWVDSGEWDDDGDNTNAGYQVPNPQFVIQMGNEQLDGWQWLPNTGVTIYIDGIEAATVQTNEWGDFSINLQNEYTFLPGMDFVVTDGVTTKTHTATNLTITAVDPDLDAVFGTADPGSTIDVWVHQENSPNIQVIADGSGNWTADFAGQWDLVPGSNGAAQENDIDGDGTWVYWYIPNPSFAVRLFDSQVEGWEWPLGANVTLDIDDPDTPQNPDYSNTQTVVVAPWNPNQTQVQFDFNYIYFIEPGHIVSLSDGNTIKTHTVFDLGISNVDENADIVNGTADPGSQIDAWICEAWGCANRHVTADPGGYWTADFANPGPGDDEQDIFDIVPGTYGDVSQSDEDGDSTQIWWNISDPHLEVSYEHNWIQISGFSAGGQVTYTIYDYEGGHALFGPVTGPVDGHGNGWISQNLFHTDLIPGMYIEALDETTGELVTLNIGVINLDYIGAGDDRAFGTAEPNSTLELQISETHDQGFNLTVNSDGSGYWEVDLAAAGYPINSYRHADVRLADAEGDYVVAQPPRVHSQVRSDQFGVDNFSKNADVTLTLYDAPGGTILYGPETLQSDGSGSAWVNLWDLGIDLVPGNYIVAYDHFLDFTKTLEVEPFTFEEMNTADDTVWGTAAPGEWVDLHVESLFSNWGTEAQTDGAGQWTADYSQDGYDITDQMWAYGWAVDEQSNWSEDHITGLPSIEASVTSDWISGFNFSPDRTIHIEIYDFEGGNLITEFDSTADGNTQFYVDYNEHQVDLQPGMYLLVLDTETSKSADLTLVYLTFDGVDYDTETAWGQADPGTQVVVRANSFFEGYETAVIADGSGNWFADFSIFGADLTPDWNLRALVYDLELDATVADAPQPPQFTAGIDGDWINGNNWTANDTVRISVYEYEGGLMILSAFDSDTDPQGNFNANLWEQNVDLQPGNYVVVQDLSSGLQKELVLADLSIEFVDFDLDVVGGLAPPATRISVGFGNENDYFEFDLFSGNDGLWQADFAAHTFNLQPDMWGNARITDEDGDATQVDASSPQYTIWAWPHDDRVEAIEWQLDSFLTMTIDDDNDPDNGVLYTVTATVGPFPFPGPQTQAVFEFQDEFDLLPGHIVRVTDGQNEKEVLITPLAITNIDIEADIIYGVAEPFTPIYFHWGPVYEVFADENGDWVFDLSGIADLDYGTSASVFQEDEDGDWIIDSFEIASPPFECEPGDTVSGFVFEGDGITPIAGAEVHFDEFYSNEPLFYTLTDESGGYSCSLPEGNYRLWAGELSWSREYYEETIFEDATMLPVTSNSAYTGINFTLDTPSVIFEHFVFNMEDPVVGDIAVRQAIAFGTDRERIIAETFPTSPLLDSYLGPDHWAYAGEGLMQYGFDPQLAGEILTQAGWIDEDGDGIRERDGERLHIEYITFDIPPDHFRWTLINIFVENMADIGVEIEVWTGPDFGDRLLTYHDFGMAEFAWVIDVNNEMEQEPFWWIYHTDNNLNAGLYQNATADQLLHTSKLFDTRAGMLPFIQQHQITVIGDLAILPIMQRMPEAEPEPSPLNSFVVFGQEGVYLKQGGTVVSGDVGANTAVSGPYLSDNSEVVIGTHVTFFNPTSRLMGDSVLVKEDAQVYDVYYNELSGNGDVLGNHYTPYAMPVVPAFPDTPVAAPGTQDIDVPKNGSLTLDAGSYGLLEAGKGATIIFSGGAYDFAEWDIGQDAKLFFEAPSEVRIAGRLLTDKGSYVGPTLGSADLSAADIVIYVLGENGNTENPNASPKAAVFGLDNIIIANVYVPNGTLHLRQGSNATGAFLGKWVLVGNYVTLTLESGW